MQNISYEEMLEAATCGAKVLHNRSVSVARKYKLPIIVKNAQNSNGGTMVTGNNIEEYGPKIITHEKDLVKVSLVGDGMQSNVDYLKNVYEVAKNMGIKIYMVSCNELSISVAVKSEVANEFTNKIHDSIILKK